MRCAEPAKPAPILSSGGRHDRCQRTRLPHRRAAQEAVRQPGLERHGFPRGVRGPAFAVRAFLRTGAGRGDGREHLHRRRPAHSRHSRREGRSSNTQTIRNWTTACASPSTNSAISPPIACVWWKKRYRLPTPGTATPAMAVAGTAGEVSYRPLVGPRPALCLPLLQLQGRLPERPRLPAGSGLPTRGAFRRRRSTTSPRTTRASAN